MPRTIVVETYQEFCERQGGRPAKIGDAWFLPSGATATQSFLGEMIMNEPPVEKINLLQNRRQYHVAKLTRVERDFQQLKGALLGLLDEHHTQLSWTWDEKEYGPVPPDRDPRYSLPDNKVWLLKLKEIVMQHRSEIEKIDQQIAELPESKEQKRQQTKAAEHDRQRREEDYAFKQEITNIEI